MRLTMTTIEQLKLLRKLAIRDRQVHLGAQPRLSHMPPYISWQRQITDPQERAVIIAIWQPVIAYYDAQIIAHEKLRRCAA